MSLSSYDDKDDSLSDEGFKKLIAESHDVYISKKEQGSVRAPPKTINYRFRKSFRIQGFGINEMLINKYQTANTMCSII